MGLEFSDIPTEDDIENIRKKYEMQKDLEGLNDADILPSGQKRRSTETEVKVEKVAKRKVQYDSDGGDEEVDL